MKEFFKNVFTTSAGVAMFILILELGVYLLYGDDVGRFFLNFGSMLRDGSLFVLAVSLVFVMLLNNFAKVMNFLNKPINGKYVD